MNNINNSLNLIEEYFNRDSIQNVNSPSVLKILEKTEGQFKRSYPTNHANSHLEVKDNAVYTDFIEKAIVKPTNGPDLSKIQFTAMSGLDNAVNTCYMASVLQALFAAPEFVETYLHNGQGTTLKRRETETEQEFAIRSHLYDLYLCTRSGTEMPKEAIQHARQLIINEGWHKGTGQHDAQEYCLFLFNILKVARFTYFQGVYQNGKKEDPEVISPSLSETMVSIIPKTGESISDLLIHEVTNLGSNALCTLSLEEESLPKILPVYLKRFDGANGKNKETVKLSDTLEIPLSFDQNRNAVYALSSVVVHRGEKRDSGHYYSYVKEYVDGKERWVKFNDSQVQLSSTAEAEKDMRENGYLFFYSRFS